MNNIIHSVNKFRRTSLFSSKLQWKYKRGDCVKQGKNCELRTHTQVLSSILHFGGSSGCLEATQDTCTKRCMKTYRVWCEFIGEKKWFCHKSILVFIIKRLQIWLFHDRVQAIDIGGGIESAHGLSTDVFLHGLSTLLDQTVLKHTTWH